MSSNGAIPRLNVHYIEQGISACVRRGHQVGTLLQTRMPTANHRGFVPIKSPTSASLHASLPGRCGRKYCANNQRPRMSRTGSPLSRKGAIRLGSSRHSASGNCSIGVRDRIGSRREWCRCVAASTVRPLLTCGQTGCTCVNRSDVRHTDQTARRRYFLGR